MGEHLAYMSGKRSYVGAAFNARPLGMPISPNWLALAIVVLLGLAINPGIWLIGAGLEGLYLWTLARNARFQATVDAENGKDDWSTRYDSLAASLDRDATESQAAVEQQAREITAILSRTGATESQISDVRQMAWLHLKLLAARAAVMQVLAFANREGDTIEEQERKTIDRLSRGDVDDELKRSLEQQLEVLRSRRAAHTDAQRRRELIDAEIERLRQQISLVREQALLATDEHSVATSLDALSASLNEANRWLKDQRELFAGLDDFTDEAPPAEILRQRAAPNRKQKVAQ
jgi:hypothetical protein